MPKMKYLTVLQSLSLFVVAFGGKTRGAYTDAEWEKLTDMYHDAQEILHNHNFKTPWR